MQLIRQYNDLYYLANWREELGFNKRLDPPTMAASHSPFRIALKAEFKANNELLQDASNKKDGPVSPSTNEIRLANIARLQLLD